VKVVILIYLYIELILKEFHIFIYVFNLQKNAHKLLNSVCYGDYSSEQNMTCLNNEQNWIFAKHLYLAEPKRFGKRQGTYLTTTPTKSSISCLYKTNIFNTI
jgi:hypothetical protein